MGRLRLRLRHLHLPSVHPHYIPYGLASRVQEHLRRQHLDFKDGSTTGPQPPPFLISFTPSPIYTLGRRQTSPLTPSELTRLTAPLQIPAPPSQHDAHHLQPPAASVDIRPRVLHSPRGGLTTYHGPGQVVLWPVLDLKSRHHRHFTVKCYARLLESTTIATLQSLFGIEAATTDDPGVWVQSSSSSLSSSSSSSSSSAFVPSLLSQQQQQQQQGDGTAAAGNGGGDRAKIAALGVHLRRHVTALGTAVNIAMPGVDVTDEAANPWARIVACGLAGRGVTSVAGELAARGAEGVDELLLRRLPGVPVTTATGHGGGSGGRERAVAGAWAEELAGRIGLDGGVEVVDREEVVRLMEGLVREEAVNGGHGGEETWKEEQEYIERMGEICARR